MIANERTNGLSEMSCPPSPEGKKRANVMQMTITVSLQFINHFSWDKIVLNESILKLGVSLGEKKTGLNFAREGIITIFIFRFARHAGCNLNCRSECMDRRRDVGGGRKEGRKIGRKEDGLSRLNSVQNVKQKMIHSRIPVSTQQGCQMDSYCLGLFFVTRFSLNYCDHVNRLWIK